MCLGTDIVLCLTPVRNKASKAKKVEVKVPSAVSRKPEVRGIPAILAMKVEPEASTSTAPKRKARAPKKVVVSEAQAEGGEPSVSVPKRRGRPPGSKNKAPRKDKGKSKQKGKEKAVEPERVIESEDEPDAPQEKVQDDDDVDPQMDYDMNGLLRMDGVEEENEDGGGVKDEGSGESNAPMSGPSFMKVSVMQGASSASQPAEVETSVDILSGGTVQVGMVHGDILVVSGEDFAVRVSFTMSLISGR
jgi:hypothetical protein